MPINYLLGPLRFLASGDDVLPGNLGLWDQNFAIKWVKENIEVFGGDQDKVISFAISRILRYDIKTIYINLNR